MNYVYIIKCHDDTLYTGYTNDVAKRFLAHSAGKGAKYTKYRGPLTLVYVEEFETKSEAMKREWEIKHSLSHDEKLELIKKSKVKVSKYLKVKKKAKQ